MQENEFAECDAIAHLLGKTLEEGDQKGISPGLRRTIESLRKNLNVALLGACGSATEAMECERYDSLFQRTAALLTHLDSKSSCPTTNTTLSDYWDSIRDTRAIERFISRTLPSEKEKICIQMVKEAISMGPENICEILNIDPGNVSLGIQNSYKEYLLQRIEGRTVEFVQNEGNFSEDFIVYLKMQLSTIIKNANERIPDEKGISSCTIVVGGKSKGTVRNVGIRRGRKR